MLAMAWASENKKGWQPVQMFRVATYTVAFYLPLRHIFLPGVLSSTSLIFSAVATGTYL
jgi:hypothetical protein